MTPEEILKKNVQTITFGKLIGTPIEQVVRAMKEYAHLQCAAKDAQISDLEKRLKEVSAIAVDLGGK